MAIEVSAVEPQRGSLPLRAARSVLAVVRSDGPIGQVVRFTWHFAQMAVIMMLGMIPLGFILSALGQNDLSSRSPEVYALAMAASMVLPMGAFMLVRGHSRERTGEMCVAMSASTVVAAGASLAGLLPHTAALSTPVSTLMWVGMIGAMLFRWTEYAGHHHGHASPSTRLAGGELR